MHRLRAIWFELPSSLWFLPSLIVTGAVFLAIALIGVDAMLGPDFGGRWPYLFGGGAEGSRGMLSAIASSMITVAGVAFSITIVTLTLASSQFSSRVLRNFMGDRTNQAVLGVLIGTFAYCLVVLRSIRSGDEGRFVPSVAVATSIALAFLGIGFLIYFIHHIALSIQAAHLLPAITSETLAAIDHLFPDGVGDEAEPQPALLNQSRELCGWQSVAAKQNGYLQRIETDDLIQLACERDAVIRMETRVGQFVIEGTPLVSVARAHVDDALADRLAATFTIQRQRTVHQDAGFGVRQIVDVALKALSPGINDTTTAEMCVRYLTAILVRLAGRQLETPFRAAEGKLRLIAVGPTFASLVSEALDEIRHHSAGDPRMLRCLLDCLQTTADFTDSTLRRQVLRRQVELIHEVVGRTIDSPSERQELTSLASILLEKMPAAAPPMAAPHVTS